MTKLTGVIFDIQRSAMHDGPGIRTTVFFQGCPLRCRWCHNPESWARPWLKGQSAPKSRSATADEILEVVELDRAFYERSGGGLTVSGGEPTAQPEFLVQLLTEAKSLGFHTCLDTTGLFGSSLLARLLPITDVFLLDYKASSSVEHQELTGVDNRAIAATRKRLVATGANVILRCPLIDGANVNGRHLSEIARISRQVAQTQLLPYHSLGRHKYEALGIRVPLAGVPSMSRDRLDELRDAIVLRGGVRVEVG